MYVSIVFRNMDWKRRLRLLKVKRESNRISGQKYFLYPFLSADNLPGFRGITQFWKAGVNYSEIEYCMLKGSVEPSSSMKEIQGSRWLVESIEAHLQECYFKAFDNIVGINSVKLS